MKLKPIKSKKDYEAYLEWVDSLFDKKVKPNSPDGEALQVALLLTFELARLFHRELGVSANVLLS